MPLYEYICKSRKPHLFEAVVAVDRRNEPLPCRFCKSTATRKEVVPIRGHSSRPLEAQGFRAPFYYQDANGELRFPGQENSAECKRLEKRGFEKVELKTASEVRKFEKSMNRRERAKYDHYIAAKEARFAAIIAENRKELRAALATGRMVVEDSERADRRKYTATLDEQQKDIIRAAMAATDARRPYDPHFDPGFHLDAFSNDFSNREAHRDVSTGWRGRKQ